jgi:hypothetical protein
MIRKCLAAHTSTESFYPAFINITMVDHGFVEITIRPTGTEDKCGDPVTITLSGTEFNALIGELVCRR